MNKKAQQLGMNPSTASGRLVKDLLFQYAVVLRNQVCYQCNKAMSREDFSIDHKVPWLDSEDPLSLYFDLENVAFSHNSCNTAARRANYRYATKEEAIEGRRLSRKACNKKNYTAKKRRERYLRLGT